MPHAFRWQDAGLVFYSFQTFFIYFNPVFIHNGFYSCACFYLCRASRNKMKDAGGRRLSLTYRNRGL